METLTRSGKLASPFYVKIVQALLINPVLFLLWNILTFLNYLQALKAQIKLRLPLVNYKERAKKRALRIVKEIKDRSFTKLPKHLAFIIKNEGKWEEDEMLDKLAELACLAWAAGIRFVTIYTTNGLDEGLLRKLPSRCGWRIKDAQSLGLKLPSIKLRDLEGRNIFNFGNKEVNSTLAMTLFVLAPDSGEKYIEKAHKSICYNGQKFDAVSFDAEINAIIGWDNEEGFAKCMDPDLAMCFGTDQSTKGFLPWHLKLTEIHWLPPLREAETDDFFWSLRKFDGCEQRCGK